MMDLTLRCNSLKCRSPLNDRAVVTTCSHVFCLPCSDPLGLSGSASSVRACPACDTQLSNPDDAVVTQLNPTEDYKTSVLSGLSPSLIMECATRGMAFFQYQTTQEIMYQDYMVKSLTDKYAVLSSQMDNVITDANAEILSLRDRLSGLYAEKKNLEQKNQELAGAFREKSKAQQRLQGLYQKLKSQQNAHHIEHAAADDADDVIHSINGATHFSNDAYGGMAPQRPPVPHSRGQDLPQIYSHARVGSTGSGGSGKRNNVTYQQGAQYSHTGHGSVARNSAPPSGMYPGRSSSFLHPGAPGPGGNLRQATPNRQPLGVLEQNVPTNQGMHGYGMSGSAKAGRGPTGQFTRPSQGRGAHVLHR